MAITVKFFARLREEVGRADDVVAFEPGLSVTDVWRSATHGRAMPESLLVAVNMAYARGDVELRDGDEVAFFPPVTGG
ncbi:MAG: MoaD/ThiS family protein [Gammaproteobacteria bacterium]|nr:MoaD/ThiS family protein [Gammaproteobacteria bacterium]